MRPFRHQNFIGCAPTRVASSSTGSKRIGSVVDSRLYSFVWTGTCRVSRHLLEVDGVRVTNRPHDEPDVVLVRVELKRDGRTRYDPETDLSEMMRTPPLST